MPKTATVTVALSESIPAGHVAVVPSMTNPNKGYEIRMGKDGNLYCGCPAWRFQKKHPHARTCKHIKAFLAGKVKATVAA